MKSHIPQPGDGLEPSSRRHFESPCRARRPYDNGDYLTVEIRSLSFVSTFFVSLATWLSPSMQDVFSTAADLASNRCDTYCVRRRTASFLLVVGAKLPILSDTVEREQTVEAWDNTRSDTKASNISSSFV